MCLTGRIKYNKSNHTMSPEAPSASQVTLNKPKPHELHLHRSMLESVDRIGEEIRRIDTAAQFTPQADKLKSEVSQAQDEIAKIRLHVESALSRLENALS